MKPTKCIVCGKMIEPVLRAATGGFEKAGAVEGVCPCGKDALVLTMSETEANRRGEE